MITPSSWKLAELDAPGTLPEVAVAVEAEESLAAVGLADQYEVDAAGFDVGPGDVERAEVAVGVRPVRQRQRAPEVGHAEAQWTEVYADADAGGELQLAAGRLGGLEGEREPQVGDLDAEAEHLRGAPVDGGEHLGAEAALPVEAVADGRPEGGGELALDAVGQQALRKTLSGAPIENAPFFTRITARASLWSGSAPVGSPTIRPSISTVCRMSERPFPGSSASPHESAGSLPP